MHFLMSDAVCLTILYINIFALKMTFVYLCVSVMMPFSSTLLCCQHRAGDCHAHQPPYHAQLKTLLRRVIFSVRTDNLLWHQVVRTRSLKVSDSWRNTGGQ